MRKIGMYMAFFGLFAIVLNFIDRVPTILIWIYNWGEGVAWGIKIGLVVVGAILFFIGKGNEEEEVAATGVHAAGSDTAGADGAGEASEGSENQ